MINVHTFIINVFRGCRLITSFEKNIYERYKRKPDDNRTIVVSIFHALAEYLGDITRANDMKTQYVDKYQSDIVSTLTDKKFIDLYGIGYNVYRLKYRGPRSHRKCVYMPMCKSKCDLSFTIILKRTSLNFLHGQTNFATQLQDFSLLL